VDVQVPLVQIKVYTPGALKVVIVVLALAGVVMAAVPGLPACAVHVPVPVAPIVADPPGSTAQFTVLLGPALGCAVTVTVAVEVHVPFVQTKVYTPAALKFVIVVVGLVGVVIVAVPGFPAWAVHVPVAVVAAIVALPPGKTAQGTV
jgi:hypothetical protein